MPGDAGVLADFERTELEWGRCPTHSPVAGRLATPPASRSRCGPAPASCSSASEPVGGGALGGQGAAGGGPQM